ncbi:ABC transporter permease [Microvirga rosea]|uniref:ABC transporter permease n=1 Tax=Microvirga rosea TaxID=2715425 RepID=UPI001D0B6AA9|nr:ABC transporter permease [Microvirga rosea]MCB8822010.1 ABC transporter permease [Microvirga rosea]
MLTYLGRRLIASIFVILMVAIFVFSLLYLTPGDPAAIIAGDQATPEMVARIRQSLKLDEPYLVRFSDWLLQIVQGDLGNSIYTGQPILQQIGLRFGPTLSLMVVSMTLSTLVAIPLGIVAAWKQNSRVDRGLMVFSTLGFSIPVFVVGYLLAYFFGLKLKWLPVQGYAPLSSGLWNWMRHLILPSIALGSAFIGLLARMTRAAMLQVLSQDYVRTAKAKGLGQGEILFRHALKNAAVPITTVVGLGIAGLISGAVVTESVFALPGLGRMTADAILRRDYPVIQSLILLFSLNYLIVNLLVDITYTFFDPRVRY